MTSLILEETQGAVRILTLNRPEKRNALNAQMHQDLLAAFARADADPALRCIVLAGAGKSFCAGADLAEHRDRAQLAPAENKRRIEQMAQLQLAVSQLGKPVIAAVQGTVLGAGAGLALSADIVLIASDAHLGYPEVPHGMVPTLMVPALVHQLGRRAALEILMLGLPVDATRAVALGLANEALEPAALMPRALALGSQFAQMDGATLRTTKQLFYRVADMPLEDGMRACVAATLETAL